MLTYLLTELLTAELLTDYLRTKEAAELDSGMSKVQLAGQLTKLCTTVIRNAS